jgi:hypothetical protein
MVTRTRLSIAYTYNACLVFFQVFHCTQARAQNICYFSDIPFLPRFTVPTAWSATTKVNYRIKVAAKNSAQVFSAHPSRPHNLLTKTAVTLATSPTAQEATTRQDRERDILPSHLKI